MHIYICNCLVTFSSLSLYLYLYLWYYRFIFIIIYYYWLFFNFYLFIFIDLFIYYLFIIGLFHFDCSLLFLSLSIFRWTGTQPNILYFNLVLQATIMSMRLPISSSVALPAAAIIATQHLVTRHLTPSARYYNTSKTKRLILRSQN